MEAKHSNQRSLPLPEKQTTPPTARLCGLRLASIFDIQLDLNAEYYGDDATLNKVNVAVYSKGDCDLNGKYARRRVVGRNKIYVT